MVFTCISFLSHLLYTALSSHMYTTHSRPTQASTEEATCWTTTTPNPTIYPVGIHSLILLTEFPLCSLVFWLHYKYECNRKKIVNLLLNMDLIQSVNKPEFAGVGHVCAEKYKMDFICWDLKLYVVLPVLQHKTFIINLWIELL